MSEMILFVLAAVCLGAGMLTIAIAVLGVYKMDFIMNRMHCAAVIDALGLFLILLGLLIASHDLAYMPKLILVLVFQWVGSPIASHMVGRLEIRMDEERLSGHMNFENLNNAEKEERK